MVQLTPDNPEIFGFPDIHQVNYGEDRYEETVLFITAVLSHADAGMHDINIGYLNKLADSALAINIARILKATDPIYESFLSEKAEAEHDDVSPDDVSLAAIRTYFGLQDALDGAEEKIDNEDVQEVRRAAFSLVESSRMGLLERRADKSSTIDELKSAEKDYEESLRIAITMLVKVFELEDARVLSEGGLSSDTRLRLQNHYYGLVEKIVARSSTIDELERVQDYIPKSYLNYIELSVVREFSKALRRAINSMKTPEDCLRCLDMVRKVSSSAYETSHELRSAFRQRLAHLKDGASKTGSMGFLGMFEEVEDKLQSGNPYAYTKLPF